MKLLLFATLVEAQCTLEKTKAQFIEKDFYSFEEGYIVISGIGSYASQMACAKYAHKASEIINLGFAASLKNASRGQIVTCTVIGKYTPLSQNLDKKSEDFMKQALPKLHFSEEGLRLISSDFPIHSEKLRSELLDWDVLDMEGYGIAFAAHAFKKKCQFIKVISDFAKEGGRAYIERYKEELSHLLSEAIL